jgi:hypothetical protein
MKLHTQIHETGDEMIEPHILHSSFPEFTVAGNVHVASRQATTWYYHTVSILTHSLRRSREL